MRLASILSVFLLTACLPTPGADVSMNQSKASLSTAGQVPAAMNRFGLKTAPPAQRGNVAIAQDFMDLSFRMESGRPLPVFSRFEGPITVAVSGPVPGSALTDLDRLLGRFRNEAGINIREVSSGPASINIEFVTRREIQTTYANVACFVVPRVASWAEFRAARNTGVLNWASLTQRDQVSVFIPADSSAQEVRDCLHEEIAQGLGPLNDLYRLTDSVFNDDNFQTSLTGFDMTILRAYYSPELRSGMMEAEVASRLPGILDRINPAGRGIGTAVLSQSPRVWINAITTALGGSGGARENAARQALSIARAQGWSDGRLAFSYFALGRATLSRDANTAMSAFAEAGRIYRSVSGGEVHVAHVDMQVAAYALSRGDAQQAIDIANRSIPIVSAAENAALMATLMLIKAEGLELQGRDAEARAVRIDTQGWARYGFGSDAQVRARSAEITALGRRGKRS